MLVLNTNLFNLVVLNYFCISTVSAIQNLAVNKHQSIFKYVNYTPNQPSLLKPNSYCE